MEDIFAVRNVDAKTRRFIQRYASEHELNTGDALRDIVMAAEAHLKEKKQAKKYRSIFDTWEKIRFNGPGNLSESVDEIVYGEASN